MKMPLRKIPPINNSRDLWEIAVVCLAFLALLGIGISGYILIEGWSFLDALYMTVTTVATVGFGEVHPLSNPGRIFTILLIVCGVGLFGITLAKISQGLIHQQLNWLFREGRMNEKISKLKGHTIICGFGRLSRITAEELRKANQEVLIIDRDRERLATAQAAGFFTILGDASLEEVLLSAGIKTASRLLSLLPKAADNLYIILTAKEIHEGIYIVSRAEEDLDDKRLRRAGANRVIAPYRVGGMKIAESLIRPYVSEFIDLASSSADLLIEEIPVPIDSPLTGSSLKDFGIREKTNIIIAAIVSREGQTIFNPSGDTIIEPGATLIGLGMRNDIKQLEQLVDPQNK
jgi:voltage-gated potassium channel